MCLELSNLCKMLQIDKSTLHGQILYELYRCLKEEISRNTEKNIAQPNVDIPPEICHSTNINKTVSQINDLETQSKEVFLKTLEILKDDILAPIEIKKYLSHDCNKIQ